MAESFGRFNWLAKVAKIGMVSLLAVLAVAVAYTVAAGILANLEGPDVMRIVGYALAMLAELAGGVLVVVAYGLVIALLSLESTAKLSTQRVGRLESLLEASEEAIKRLTDLAPLSDQAKGMIFREREIEALREMMHECLARQDFRQAEHLIDRMVEQYGSQAEADKLRAEVAASREKTADDEKVSAAVGRVNQIIEQRNWARALRESERLAVVFPNSDPIKALPKRIEEARNKRKTDLLRDYDDAIKRNEIDRSIELLKQLDVYLTPQEAAALRESARGVFRAKLHNLGVQFAIAVTDEQWAAAVKTGEEIVREFPNTRMATEVREKLDALRHRAGAAVG